MNYIDPIPRKKKIQTIAIHKKADKQPSEGI